ncbi:hypothetical protein BGZ89_003709 [Linnemannia elongata]|nr:hypothetical protein BGZ89_003709 [Linnemannia elongata]
MSGYFPQPQPGYGYPPQPQQGGYPPAQSPYPPQPTSGYPAPPAYPPQPQDTYPPPPQPQDYYQQQQQQQQQQQGAYPPPPSSTGYPSPAAPPHYQAPPAGYPPASYDQKVDSVYPPPQPHPEQQPYNSYQEPSKDSGYPPAPAVAVCPTPPQQQQTPYGYPPTSTLTGEGDRGFFSGHHNNSAPGSGGAPVGSQMMDLDFWMRSYPRPAMPPQAATPDQIQMWYYHINYNPNNKQKPPVPSSSSSSFSSVATGYPGVVAQQQYPAPGQSPYPYQQPSQQQQYPAPGQSPYGYPQQQQQQQQPMYQTPPPSSGHEASSTGGKQGPDWMKLAGGMAAGGIALAGTKKLFEKFTEDKHRPHHH